MRSFWTRFEKSLSHKQTKRSNPNYQQEKSSGRCFWMLKVYFPLWLSRKRAYNNTSQVFLWQSQAREMSWLSCTLLSSKKWTRRYYPIPPYSNRLVCICLVHRRRLYMERRSRKNEDTKLFVIKWLKQQDSGYKKKFSKSLGKMLKCWRGIMSKSRKSLILGK